MVTAMTTTCHLGSHLDAPLHLATDGASADEVPLDRLIGRAEVVRVEVGERAAEPGDLPRGWTPSCPRILLRTDSHPIGEPIDNKFTGLSRGLIHWLADRGATTVGIDTPSVDIYDSTDLEAHHALVDRGMTWVEGLCLEKALPGPCFLVALPMALVGVEAAPVRAIIFPFDR
jgi:arylformamidase